MRRQSHRAELVAPNNGPDRALTSPDRSSPSSLRSAWWLASSLAHSVSSAAAPTTRRPAAPPALRSATGARCSRRRPTGRERDQRALRVRMGHLRTCASTRAQARAPRALRRRRVARRGGEPRHARSSFRGAQDRLLGDAGTQASRRGVPLERGPPRIALSVRGRLRWLPPTPSCRSLPLTIYSV